MQRLTEAASINPPWDVVHVPQGRLRGLAEGKHVDVCGVSPNVHLWCLEALGAAYTMIVPCG